MNLTLLVRIIAYAGGNDDMRKVSLREVVGMTTHVQLLSEEYHTFRGRSSHHDLIIDKYTSVSSHPVESKRKHSSCFSQHRSLTFPIQLMLLHRHVCSYLF